MSDVCECGVPLDVHPPLPKPGPLESSWTNRRSFSMASAGSGVPWESTPEARQAARARRLTDRAQEVVRIVAKHGGSRGAAARELGVTRQTVLAALRRAEAAGAVIPPTTTGRYAGRTHA